MVSAGLGDYIATVKMHHGNVKSVMDSVCLRKKREPRAARITAWPSYVRSGIVTHVNFS